MFSILFFEIRVGEYQVGTDIDGKPGAGHLGRASKGSLAARLNIANYALSIIESCVS